MRGLIVAALLSLSACAPAIQTLVPDGSNGYKAGAPFDVRPGEDDVIYVAGGELMGVDRSSGQVDHLLLRDESGMIDLAFRSDEELYVLERQGVSLYYGARLFSGWDLPEAVTDDARIVAGEEGVWVSTNPGGHGRLLRLDPTYNKFVEVAGFDHPVAAIAKGTEGVYFAVGNAVYRLHWDGQGEDAQVILVFAVPAARLNAIAVDPDHRILYASDAHETFFYRDGKVRPFIDTAGLLRWDDGTLYISSTSRGALVECVRAHKRASALQE